MPINEEKSPVPPNANIQEIIKKGGEIYDTLKAELEPLQNGKHIVIEVDSNKHFIADTRDEAIAKARKEFPDKLLFVRRIGQVEKASRHFSYSHLKYARLF